MGLTMRKNFTSAVPQCQHQDSQLLQHNKGPHNITEEEIWEFIYNKLLPHIQSIAHFLKNNRLAELVRKRSTPQYPLFLQEKPHSELLNTNNQNQQISRGKSDPKDNITWKRPIVPITFSTGTPAAKAGVGFNARHSTTLAQQEDPMPEQSTSNNPSSEICEQQPIQHERNHHRPYQRHVESHSTTLSFHYPTTHQYSHRIIHRTFQFIQYCYLTCNYSKFKFCITEPNRV